jgi:DNA replication protein DnaC
MTPFDPAPRASCTGCSGGGYRVQAVGERAVANKCSCIPTCTRCGGTGTLTVEENGVARTGRCRCMKLEDRIRLFNNAGIPAFHSRSSFESFEPIGNAAIFARQACQSWCTQFGEGKEKRGLVLSGKVGRGKTHLLVGVFKELVFRYGMAGRFVEFSRLLSTLKEGYGKGNDGSLLLADLVSAPVLAIDELGKGRLTDWEQSIIDEVVSRRYNAGKPILGTTNFSWAAPTGNPVANHADPKHEGQSLGDRVGGRVFSRLQELCFTYPMTGEDYRSKRDQVWKPQF